MAGLNVGDVVALSYQGLILGQRTINTLHYVVQISSTNTSVLPALTSLASAFSTGAVSPTLPLLAAMPQNWTLTHIRAQRVSPTRSAFVDYADGRPGQLVTDAESTNVNATITKRTISGTRPGIGSFHAPAIPVDGFAFGLLTAAYKILTETYAIRFINVFIDPVDNTQLQPIVFHKAVPSASFPIVSITVQNTLRVMRRRTVGVGI